MEGSSGAVVVRVGGRARGRPLLCSLRGLAETRFRRQAGVSLGLVGQLPGDLALTIARTWFEWKKIGRGVIEICIACNGHIVQASRKLAATLARVGPHDIFRRPRSQRSSHHMQSAMSTEESPHSHMPAQAPPHGCGKDHHTLAAASVKSSLAPPFPAHFQTRGQQATANRAC